jgi:hypothetical protein
MVGGRPMNSSTRRQESVRLSDWRSNTESSLTWQHDSVPSAVEQVRAAAEGDAILAADRVVGDSLRARTTRFLALAPTLLVGRSPAAAVGH